jgi:hypothetical protein
VPFWTAVSPVRSVVSRPSSSSSTISPSSTLRNRSCPSDASGIGRFHPAEQTRQHGFGVGLRDHPVGTGRGRRAFGGDREDEEAQTAGQREVRTTRVRVAGVGKAGRGGAMPQEVEP